MKKIILSATLMLLTAFAGAQEDNKCYTLKMSLKMEGLPAEMSAFGQYDITTYVKGKRTRTEINSLMFSTINFQDGNKYTSLTEASGNKTGFVSTIEEMEKLDKKEKGVSKPKIQYTNEKKIIAGYECFKAIVTSVDKENKESMVNVWYTEKIKFDASQLKKGGDMFDLGDIKGTPLEMETDQSSFGSGIKIIVTTSEVLTSDIQDSIFIPNTDGYTINSYSVWKDNIKAMSGN